MRNNKGKGTDDPLTRLPKLPEKRTKQAWSTSPGPIQFPGESKLNEVGQDSFDLIQELYKRDPKRRKLEKIRKSTNDKAIIENTNRAVGNVKKNREDFRTSLVDIIM